MLSSKDFKSQIWNELGMQSFDLTLQIIFFWIGKSWKTGIKGKIKIPNLILKWEMLDNIDVEKLSKSQIYLTWY